MHSTIKQIPSSALERTFEIEKVFDVCAHSLVVVMKGHDAQCVCLHLVYQK